MNIIREEVFAATDAFYTMMEINQFASENQANYEKINRDAAFWTNIKRRTADALGRAHRLVAAGYLACGFERVLRFGCSKGLGRY